MSTDHHRGRNVNWSQAEKDLLLRLIERHTDTIENKRSDYNSLVQRAESWAEISKEFAVTCPYGRPLKRLREQYQRMKCCAKKEYAKFADASEKGRCVSAFSRRIARLAPADFAEFLSEDESSAYTPLQIDAFFVSETKNCKVLSHSKNRFHDQNDKSTTIREEMPSPVVYIENVHNELDGTNRYSGHDDGWNHIKMEPATDACEYADQEPSEPQMFSPKAKISSHINERATVSLPLTSSSKSSKQPRLSSSASPVLTAVEKNQIALQKLEHEVKVQHMETEHRLRLDIMRLQKRLLEKQLQTLEKVSTGEMGSPADVMSRNLLGNNSFGLQRTYELD